MPDPAAHLEASGLRATADSATAKLWLGNEAAAALSPAKASPAHCTPGLGASSCFCRDLREGRGVLC